MSGESKYRDLWTNYSSKIHGIIFVVDSTDRIRLNVAASELETMLEDKSLPYDAPVLVLANKSDMK
jgi:ADP-ribosylation factor-like protein 6